MADTINQEKEQFWKTHILQAKHFNGSLNKYCQSHGLKSQTFHYWKNRIARKPSESRLPVPSPFIPLKLSTPERPIPKKSLPDARWLAEVIFELHARFQ